MNAREKLVELFYDNNVICDQKIEGLADDVIDIIDNGATKNTIGRRCPSRRKENDYDM